MKHTYTTARDILIQWWTLHYYIKYCLMVMDYELDDHICPYFDPASVLGETDPSIKLS